MLPEDIRALRSHANLVQDRLDMALMLDSERSREQFEWAESQFKEKYPHYNWRDWAEQKKEKAL